MLRSRLFSKVPRPFLCLPGNVLRPQCRHSSVATIFALSTKLGRAAIAVVRVLGPLLAHIYSRLTRKDWETDATPRIAKVRRLYLPINDELLDEALVLPFRGPHLYTGEDSVELHLHGGTAICAATLKAIASMHDPKKDLAIRYAENGEFSRRAFINGRFDLTEIEGIRQMIDAETESQRVAALSSLTGGTKTLFDGWRQEILNNVALLTTVIDFGEDHDIDEVASLFNNVDASIQRLRDEISAYLTKVTRLEVLLQGIKLVLLGPPNAGKSLLVNVLVNDDAAIVSEIAGTTRDTINVPVDISGYKVVVGDTAGIRPTTDGDSIEAEGIRRAMAKSLACDVVMVVLPVTQTTAQDLAELIGHLQILRQQQKPIMVVLNKADLLASEEDAEGAIGHYAEILGLDRKSFYLISCKNGAGITNLNRELVSEFKKASFSDAADPIVVSSRIQDLLRHDVLHGFDEFKQCKEADDVVLACESLKQSVEGIGKITGQAIGVEEILGVVFSSFCIGK